MNPITYALFTYGLTVVISFAVVGVIVLIDRAMSRSANKKGEN